MKIIIRFAFINEKDCFILQQPLLSKEKFINYK